MIALEILVTNKDNDFLRLEELMLRTSFRILL